MKLRIFFSYLFFLFATLNFSSIVSAVKPGGEVFCFENASEEYKKRIGSWEKTRTGNLAGPPHENF